MPSIFDPLINDPEDKAQNEALVRALRNQTGLGIVGQGMGLKATSEIGQGLQKGAQASFGEAMQARERAKQIAMQRQQMQAEAQQRLQQQQNWQQQYAAQRGDRADANADRDLARQAATDARNATAADREDNEKFKHSTTLRTELTQRVQAMQASTGAAQNLISLASSPDIASNPQAQTAIVFAFGKMLDPTSTVREGEYTLFEQARGMLDSWGMTPERIASGARLSPEQIKQMVSVAARITNDVKGRKDAMENYYGDMARRYKLDPSDIGLNLVPQRPAGGGAGTADNPIKVRRGGQTAPNNAQPGVINVTY